jgi:putative RNA 2'-phosphotransferase
LEALRSRGAGWSDLGADDLGDVVATSEKNRFELEGARVRARYGHSVPQRLARVEAPPPDLLFHGTSPRAWRAIADRGLVPMRRQYVHLSADVATALQVGRRKAAEPVLLRVYARVAAAAGVRFYLGNELVWLADAVPAEFVERAVEQP